MQTTLFYISGLGLTRDPYLMTSVDNMWVNVGHSQFHLITAKPQHLRGRVGLVIPGRAALLERLARMKKPLEGTRFAYKEHDDYVEFDVPVGSAKAIADFYRKVFETPARVDESGSMPAARVSAGSSQELVFRETKGKLAAYDGHHIQVYVANFSRPHKRLLERDLITEESNDYQYRFVNISDLESGKPLFQIEHEVRSMTHPL